MTMMSQGVLAAIRDEAARAYPEECCGALLGRSGAGETRVLVRALPISNASRRDRDRRYVIAPDDVLRMENEATRAGLEVMGFFHSHPDAAAVPSEFDREHAWPWYTYIIVPVRGGVVGRPRAWLLRDDRSTFEESPLRTPSGREEPVSAGSP